MREKGELTAEGVGAESKGWEPRIWRLADGSRMGGNWDLRSWGMKNTKSASINRGEQLGALAGFLHPPSPLISTNPFSLTGVVCLGQAWRG